MKEFVLATLLSMPPAQFDVPTPAHVVWKTPTEVQEICTKHMPADGPVLACALLSPQEKCIIVLPHGAFVGGWMWRHERAHCAGWRH